MKQYLNREFLLSNKEKIIKVAAITGIIAVAFFVFVLGGGQGKEELPVTESKAQASVNGAEGEATEEKGSIIVDVGGAVVTPQVVELKKDSRVADAISAAGGLKDNANTASINQAAFLTDGEKIYIPAKGEEVELPANGTQTGNAGTSRSGASGKVNINQASAIELQTLDGVGPATAEKILNYREKTGRFAKIDDLKNVKGIGEKTFEKLKEHIMV